MCFCQVGPKMAVRQRCASGWQSQRKNFWRKPGLRWNAGVARLRVATPYLLALLLFGLGAYALYHLLRPVDIHAVADQIRSTPWQVIALALGATFAGYLCLAAYDWSALRHIGKRLPLPVVISGGCLAYAFGNTVGLTAVSGGAVRWRLYSGLDLDGYDIAAVSTFTAVAFGVASTVVGLAALATHPILIERPIGVCGQRAVIGRPPENALELLDTE